MTYLEDENGRLVHGFGALFPDGYLSIANPDGKSVRWVCPIQGCGHERSYLKSHGKHFLKEHKTCLLHDNQDGTFAIAGYNVQDAPVVVSRGQQREEPSQPAADTLMAGGDESVPPNNVSKALDPGGNAGEGAQNGQDNEPGRPFFFAPSGRPYSMYPGMYRDPYFQHPGVTNMLSITDQGGAAHGVLIPDGYKRPTTGEKTWVCPIRSCLMGWATQNGLSIHFAVREYNPDATTLFDDNVTDSRHRECTAA